MTNKCAYLYVLRLTLPEDDESTSKSNRDRDPAAEEALFPIESKKELVIVARGTDLMSERNISKVPL